MTTRLAIARAARLARAGGLIAYPTEAVYGLGCLPENRVAVERLLTLKRRSWRKGLVLIGATVAQVERYVFLPAEPRLTEVLSSWPGPATWVLRARPGVPRWIRGAHDSVAVRVTAHPLARTLCTLVGAALVSTSANVSRRPPFRRVLPLRRALGRGVDLVLAGELGTLSRPTVIRDGATGRVLRG